MTGSTTKKKGSQGPGLAILDGHSLLHRAYYALPRLTNLRGEVTNAVYGFTMMLMRLLEEEQPQRVVVAFDRPAPTFRHQEFEQYKANRKPMPDDLRPQVPLCEEVLAAFGIPAVGVPGFEADDLIGTLSCQAAEAGLDTLIVTGDRDALQLISDQVKVMLTKRGITDTEVLGPAEFAEKYAITPHQFTDVKALMGDPSDNIPGVPGIGEKGALRLIQEYGSVENLLAHTEEVGGRTGELLRTYADQARLSRRLATIDCSAPVPLSVADLQGPQPDYQRLRDLFTALEFRNLVKRLPAGKGETTGEAMQGTLFGPASGDDPAPKAAPAAGAPAAAPSPAAFIEPEWSVVTSPAELAEAVQELSRAGRRGVAALVEQRLPWQRDLAGLALAAGDRAWFVWSRAALGFPAGLDVTELKQILAPLFQPGHASLSGHDLKLLSLALGPAGEPEEGPQAACPGPLAETVPFFAVEPGDFDVMLASYVLDPTRGSHSLEEIAFNYLGLSLPARSPLPDPGAGEAAWQAVAGQTVRQAAVALALSTRLEELLAEGGLTHLYREVELALVPVLAAMERRGVAVDVERLKELAGDLDRRSEALAAEIFAEAGEEFNLNSPKQLAHLLFEKLGLPAGKKTKTGYSTSAEVLEDLALEHPIARRILDYRQLVKLKTTYVDALPTLINPRTGRVHTTFNQAVTATGRLSSTNPNLQNIPVRTEEGGRVREAFVAGGQGNVLLSADYSQIELRVMAHLSGDPILSEAFRSGEDIHTRTAAEMFGIRPEEVTPELRSGAKAINFGIIYGISSFGLARGTKITRQQAQEFINSYFARYARVKQYLDEVVAEARERGFVTTVLGRRRYLPDLHSRNFALRSFAERTAMNTPIQGTAADIIKLAMLACERELSQRGLCTRMVLQVHDELVFEGPESEVAEVAAVVRRAMEGALALSVPLVVEVEAGRNWREGEEVPRA
ncbi:MAG: DNA polymerase I [Chitinophagales bacterium]